MWTYTCVEREILYNTYQEMAILKCEMIWKIWKKGKSNSEKIWKIQKKVVKRYEKYGKYGRIFFSF